MEIGREDAELRIRISRMILIPRLVLLAVNQDVRAKIIAQVGISITLHRIARYKMVRNTTIMS